LHVGVLRGLCHCVCWFLYGPFKVPLNLTYLHCFFEHLINLYKCYYETFAKAGLKDEYKLMTRLTGPVETPLWAVCRSIYFKCCGFYQIQYDLAAFFPYSLCFLWAFPFSVKFNLQQLVFSACVATGNVAASSIIV